MGESGKRGPTYFSVYRHGVDDKRRLQIPSKWRGTESGEELTFVVWPEEHEKSACLMGFPTQVIWQIIDDLSGTAFTDREVNAIRRSIGERSDTAALDKNGRLCIPEWMMREVGIKNNVVMVGLMDRFQIWSPERYEASKVANDAIATNAWQKVLTFKSKANS